MYKRLDDKINGSVDWFVIAIYVVLLIGGWFSIYGASYQYDAAVSMFDISGRAGQQLVWIGTALILAFVLLKLDSGVYDIFAYLIYAFFIFLLFVTIFLAPDIKGSHSWLVITKTIRLQPAEFAKFAVALALSKYISEKSGRLMSFKNLLFIGLLIFVPIGLILLEDETGSALVYLSFFLMLYREGLSGKFLLLGLCTVVFFIVGIKFSGEMMGLITQGEFISVIIILLITSAYLYYIREVKPAITVFCASVVLFGGAYLVQALVSKLIVFHVNWGIIALSSIGLLLGYLIFLSIKRWTRSYLLIGLFAIGSIGVVYSVSYVFKDIMLPHQQVRIRLVLGMEEDLKGAGYNVNQSKIAIGSGGFLGKGFLNGTQTKLKFVPEQDTDFIFCTVGEEQGFVGSVAVLLLFLTLILRLVYLAERQRSSFGRVYGYCVVCVFLFHLVINVGMVLGITPVIGIPLPFFSYGGSSLWAFTILLFIFLRIDMSRKRR